MQVVIVSRPQNDSLADLYMIRVDPKQGPMWGATSLNASHAQKFTPDEAAALIAEIVKTHPKTRRVVTERA